VLSADTTYVLTGLYYVEAPHKITIQPGTLILGNQATTGTLIITRGAQVFAQGTVNHPIVFTSAKAPGSRAPGDWGGIIVLGGAPTNKVDPVIEGGIISGSCGGGSGTYGGANANDNSGILSYIRIEYAGYRFQVNNEINGLTMGGVGAGTQIDHIQVSYSLDDSYEWFGGTVNCKYLVCYGGTDDEQDTDFGFSGHVQFVLGLRDPDFWDTTGQSNGFESDNDGTSTSTDNPHTHAIFSNVTLIGPERNNAEVPFPLASTAQYGALLRRSTQECVYNSVIMGYPWNLAVRDATTQGFATGGQLQIRYDSFQATTIPSGSSTTLEHSTWAGIEAWFATPGFNNINSNAAVRQPDTIKLNDMSNLNNPDPRPQTTSELVGSADFTNANLTDPFFTPVHVPWRVPAGQPGEQAVDLDGVLDELRSAEHGLLERPAGHGRRWSVDQLEARTELSEPVQSADVDRLHDRPGRQSHAGYLQRFGREGPHARQRREENRFLHGQLQCRWHGVGRVLLPPDCARYQRVQEDGAPEVTPSGVARRPSWSEWRVALIEAPRFPNRGAFFLQENLVHAAPTRWRANRTEDRTASRGGVCPPALRDCRPRCSRSWCTTP
jgi:hypothetical protein